MSSLTLVTGPTVEPLSVEDVKLHSRIDEDDDDILILSKIKGARREAENFTHRTLITTTFDWRLDGFPAWFCVPVPPLQSVTSIKYIDENGTEQTLSSSNYDVDTFSEPGRITPAYDQVWPSTRAVVNSVTVRFVAGYGSTAASVPEDIRNAMHLNISDLYEHRENIVLGMTVNEINNNSKAMLRPYRVDVFGGQ